MIDYREYNEGTALLKIQFEAPDLDLREVGLVSTQLHRIVNKVAESVFELPAKNPVLYSRTGPYGGLMFSRPYDPVIVTLQITSLAYGSLLAEMRPRVHRVARDLAVGAVGSLIASVIWSVAESAPKSVAVPERPKAEIAEAPQPATVDVGPNVTQIATGMAATGKPWKLTIEDVATGQKVVIESKR